MAVKKNQAEAHTENQSAKEDPAENAASELREPRWSVVSFDRCEASGLTYAEAEKKLSALEAQKISGLCIITDEAAARLAGQK